MKPKTVKLYDCEIHRIVGIINESDDLLKGLLVKQIVSNTEDVRNDYDFLMEFLDFAIEEYGNSLKNHKGGAVVAFMEKQKL